MAPIAAFSLIIFLLQIKPVTTRKLRRRPNDPINVNSSAGSSDKRRKLAPAQLAYLLDESEIIDDLRAITRGTGTSGKSCSP